MISKKPLLAILLLGACGEPPAPVPVDAGAAPDAAIRVPRDGSTPLAEADLVLEASFVSVTDGSGVADATVCVREHPELGCMSGRSVRLGPFAIGERLTLELTHPDYVRQLLRWQVDRSRFRYVFRLVPHALLEAIAAERGLTLDPSRGFVGGLTAEFDSFDNTLAGVAARLDPPEADPTYVLSRTPPFTDPGATATGDTGLFAFLDVPPGMYTITVDAPERSCPGGTHWPVGADRFEVPVEAGAMSTVYVVCDGAEAHDADEGETCRGADTFCLGSDAACLRGADGRRCVSHIGPCQPESACFGDIALTGCTRWGQPTGTDCFARGGRCQMVDSRPACRAEVGGPCDEDLSCDTEARCEAGTCVAVLDCQAYFECNAACGDDECRIDCDQHIAFEAVPRVESTYRCFAAAGCSTLAECQAACPIRWAGCVE